MNMLNFEDQLRAIVEELKNTVLERTDEMNNKHVHKTAHLINQTSPDNFVYFYRIQLFRDVLFSARA